MRRLILVSAFLVMGSYTPKRVAQQSFTFNTTESTIYAQDQNHPAVGAPTTLSSGITVNAGTTATINSFADYSGTVAGTISATTAAAHGLSTGEWVVVLGDLIEAGDPQPYYGVYQITVIDTTSFYFTSAAWNGTSTGYVYRGDQFVVPHTGWYKLSAYGTFQSAGANQTYQIDAYVNGTLTTPFAIEITAKSAGALSSAAIAANLSLTAGDVLWYSVSNLTSAANFTLQTASIHLETN